jgi:hypothetical protein
MRCDTKPHQVYCGIDFRARTMDGCILTQDGAMLLFSAAGNGTNAALPSPCPRQQRRHTCVVSTQGVWSRE